MPDIAMCFDHECPARVHCYRYRAKPFGSQTYGNFTHDGEKCVHYWSTNGYDDHQLKPMVEIEADAQLEDH